MKITPELIEEHGLTFEEYEKILEILGREPTFTELGIFSVMWSEHCSYKNSKALLKMLPTEGEYILQGPGENAGAVDIGDGYAIVFKIESHNHPSAVEPFEGAATGVGGILRDIFTMGARPIALLDPLRFGELNDAKTRYLANGVISGISHYGNCVGVPTVGGEFMVEDSYKGNPLVNVMCIGIVKKDKIIRAKAEGVGNPVYYFGNATGRDGIHGATFASEELGEDVEDKRPSVQVGDPFTEKLILEATLELIESGCLVAIQDMGAAGLTCSSAEMAGKGNVGIEIDLDKVPQRAKNMTAYEIMLSESQERMLAVCKKGKEHILENILRKWELEPYKIGHLTDDGKLTVKFKGEVVASIPAKQLSEDAPVYKREGRIPSYFRKVNKEFDFYSLKEYSFKETLSRMFGHPNFAKKNYIFEQYDYMVQTNTVILPGQDAAVLQIKGSKKGIAVATDGNGYYCYLNPYEGAKIAVSQCARNLVAVGAKPLAITNCLNFGNPIRADIYWQFEQCIKGMKDACEYLNTPVTGGNVSFYNETKKGDKTESIYPTPVIGMIGLIEDIKNIVTFEYKDAEEIYLIGNFEENIGGSQFLKIIYDRKIGPCPVLDLEREKKVQDFILKGIEDNLFSSVHDVSEGGIIINILESLFGSEKNLGVEIYPKFEYRRLDFAMYSEFQSAFVVSISSGNREKLKKYAMERGIEIYKIGKILDKPVIRIGSEEIKRAFIQNIYETSLYKILMEQ